MSEIIVIGGGLAGLSAAAQIARLGKNVTIFEGSGMYGGLVATVDTVDGLPVPGKYSGQDLAIHLLEDVRKSGAVVVEAEIMNIDTGKTLTVTDLEDKTYKAEAIIIASGAHLRKLAVPGEDEFTGRGVSRCATCDGGFFRGQDVVVVGGGDAAVEEALVLAKLCRKVIMICRSKLKAKREYIEKIASRDNVTFIWGSEVTEILGDNSGVNGVRVRNLASNTVTDIACAGVFPFIGVEPNTGFLPSSLRGNDGLIETGADFVTADPRIFAVGAVRKSYGGNIVQAMSEGIGAAEAATRLL